MFTTRTIASLTIVAVGAAFTACASDDSDRTAPDTSSATSPAATEPPGTDATSVSSPSEVVASSPESTAGPAADPPASTAPPPTVASTTATPPDETLCVEPPDLVLPAPVEPDAAPLAFDTDPTAGRYRSEQLGVALAFDVADTFVDAVWVGDAISLVGEFNAASSSFAQVAIARPITYLAGEPDAQPKEVDLDTWLAETNVEILNDAPVDLAGHSAREIVLRIPGEPNEPGVITEEETSVAFTAGLAPTPSGDATERLIEVDTDHATPLLFWVHVPPGDTDFDTVARAFIDSVTVGETTTAPGIVLADTPWDRSWGERTLLGPCTVPAMAFGGIEIGLSQPTLVAGQGNELWFASSSEEFSGFDAPRVFVQQPTELLDGTAVEDAAGVIAAYADAGYELTELDDQGVTLFGSPARTFEFSNSAGVAFRASDHDASVGTELSVIVSGGRTGVVHVADTQLGPILVQMDAELGTDDLMVVEPILADLIGSIR